MAEISGNQDGQEGAGGLLNAEERAVCIAIAAMEPPYSSRAEALLALDVGATQAEAGRQAGLTYGQVHYWLGKFRKQGLSVFPEELRQQAEPAAADAPQRSPEPPVPAEKLDLGAVEDEEDGQQEAVVEKETAVEEMAAAETAVPDDEKTAQGAITSTSKKKDKKVKKSKKGKKSKKSKKVKGPKKKKKAKKGKKSAKTGKKKKSKKAKGGKGKSGKKKKKKNKK